MTYYGVVNEIRDVNYNFFPLSVFKCDWVDNSRVKTNDLGCTCVNYGFASVANILCLKSNFF